MDLSKVNKCTKCSLLVIFCLGPVTLKIPNAPSPTILCKEMSSKRTSHGSKSSELDLKDIHKRIKNSSLPKVIYLLFLSIDIGIILSGGRVLPRILDRGVPQRFLNPNPI